LSDAARVLAIGLDRHRRKRRFHMPGFKENGLEPRLHHPGVQPLRQWSGLETDPLDRKPESAQKGDQNVGIAGDLDFPDDHPLRIHDADNSRDTSMPA
jgi:hypothetical protein